MKLQYNDQQHAYFLDGKRCKSISAVAKIPDDTFSLDQWRKRQILIGVATQPQLVEQAAAHFDDRDQLNRIAEQALQAARANDAANRGTAAHRITERVDLGELILDSPQARAVSEAWQRGLDLAGLEIVPELVERIVVWPRRMIAGRFDRIARRKTDGRYVILDLKNGANAAKYPHSVAIQLALYANAPLMAGELSREGGTTTVFEKVPDMDRTVGYMIHMPTEGEVNVLALDLTAARAGVAACFQVLDWRKTERLIYPVTEVQVGAIAAGSATGDGQTAQSVENPTLSVASNSPTRPLEVMSRDDWIRGRLNKIADGGPEPKAAIAQMWPPGVPTRPPWDDQQIDALDFILADVEASLQSPFPEPDPAGRYNTLRAVS